MAEAPDAGVIEEARARQQRHRAIGSATLAVAVLAGVVAFGLAGGGAPTGRSAPPPRLGSSLTWLTGPRLEASHLKLVASENGGSAAIVDVDTGRVAALPQLDIPTRPMLGPYLSLALVTGGALAVVNHQACDHCAITEDDFLVRPGGTVRRVATRHFASLAGTTERAQVPGSTAEWVLRWPHHGRCTLHLVPSAHPAVTVPCGNLGQAFPSGVTLWTDHDQRAILVNPSTGAVNGALNPAFRYDPIGDGLAIEGTPAADPRSLSLVSLTTGTRRVLGWPSRLHFGYQVFPDPAGPSVAIEFADPAYTPIVRDSPTQQTIGQASDIWLLNTRTATLTHVPGFPILVRLKQSGIAWTADGRLVIAARGGGFAQPETRTVIGVWRPGQPTLRVGRLPALNGYSQFVPLVG
jgi:hypothetical protein